MRNVRQLLESKPAEVFSISPDAAVIDAIRLMAQKGIGALLVMEGPRLSGIVSERDYARKVVLEGRSSKETQVREIMSDNVTSVAPDDTCERCMALITALRIRHLPVMQDGGVVGILSIGDLVKAVIEDQQVQLEQMERYIAG
ncbi:MAG: CBS domain-containing protein [Pseudoxanthomonas suwonensis]|nr:CBS domain-containing protein [Pseudoxanthomonas suwonensis]